MSTNAKAPTPLDAYNLFVKLAQLPDLRLNLQEHTNIQIALDVLKPLVQPVELTKLPEDSTI